MTRSSRDQRANNQEEHEERVKEGGPCKEGKQLAQDLVHLCSIFLTPLFLDTIQNICGIYASCVTTL